MLSKALYSLKHGTEFLNYGRHLVESWAVYHASALRYTPRILDLGMGNGADLENMRKCLGRPVNLYGLDIGDSGIKKARDRGISVACIDIERERYPFDDCSIDIVLANQVIEHTKEIFWIFSEVSRILVSGGLFVVGVPNLASLHNRIALLFGSHPPTIRVLGPHVRGFTKDSFLEFAECGGCFKVLEVRGSNFYPFPPWLSMRLVRALPTLAVSLYFRLGRTAERAAFLDVLHDIADGTRYFGGEET